jgi:outer membrane protein assembly factor BamE
MMKANHLHPLLIRGRARVLMSGLLATLTLLGMSLSGCVHRIDIQQGNFLEAKDIDRVTTGMTRVQVRALLGTPMVADPFTSSRWDYVYYLKKGRWHKPEQRHFIVFFDADKVNRIDRSDQATAAGSTNPPVNPPSG